MDLSTLFKVCGGIGLFLFGVKLMSGALQDLAGDKMRTLIASLTSSTIKGAFVGAVVTMVIHSSAATTIMAVSFVQAGMMTLKQALGVIMGANIGTTVTAQMVAFDVNQLAMPLLGVGMVLAVFGRSKRQRYIGNGIFGFGLLCLGMETMQSALAFLADKKEFFAVFAQHPMLCVAAGTVLTMIVQSSTATVGLTIAMATQGLLPLQSSIAILLGNNLGTTVTAVLAALGASRSAKQAAAGHVFFNLAGVLLFLPFLPLFTHVIEAAGGGIARQLANAHTIFNVVNTVIQLPFALWLALRLARPIKGRTALLSIYFMPVLISTVVIGQLWLKIYNPDYGVLNVFLRSIGLEKWTHIWLGDKKYALRAAFVPILWQYVGYHMLLMYAGIKGVPMELTEAAMLDGCTPAQASRYIIIPYIRPILRVSVIFAITGSLKSFDLIYVLTNGGPSHVTEVPSTLMISMLFLRNRYGMGSAIAVMLIALCFFFALVINAVFKEEK